MKNHMPRTIIYSTAFIILCVAILFIVSSEKDVGIGSNQALNDFLIQMPTADGNFLTKRLDYSMDKGDIDQTYYHLLVQQIFHLNTSNAETKRVFNRAVLNKIKSDLYYIKYVSSIVEESKNFIIDHETLSLIDREYEQRLNMDLAGTDPEILYYLSKFQYYKNNRTDSRATSKIAEILKKEQDTNNIIILAFWYFDLIKLGFEQSEDHDEIVEKVHSQIQSSLNTASIEDAELLYYLTTIQAWNKEGPRLTNHRLAETNSSVVFELDSRQLFYKVKTQLLLGSNYDYKHLFSEYYRAFRPMKDHLYPAYVIETNNQVEMMMWDILVTKLLKIQPDVPQMNSRISGNIFASSSYTDSTKQIYHEVLFCYLHKEEYPAAKVEHLRELLDRDGDMLNKYYLYQAAHLLGMRLKVHEATEFRLEAEHYAAVKDEEGIINMLDLWLAFDLDGNYAKQYWDRNKAYLHTHSDKLTMSLFFRYQMLTYHFTRALDMRSINRYFVVRDIDHNLLIRGQRGEMDIEALYYYYALRTLSSSDQQVIDSASSDISVLR